MEVGVTENCFIMQKLVDKSVLYDGFTIPMEFVNLFFDKVGIRLEHGETCEIKVSVNGRYCPVNFTSINFDRAKFPGHDDLVQVRYNRNSTFAVQLRETFSSTNELWNEWSHTPHSPRSRMPIPEGKKEYLVLYATPVKGELFAECITAEEYRSGMQAVKALPETQFENITDVTAGIIEKPGVVKLRHVANGIGNSLKAVYGYRCQVCGEYIGEKYGSQLIHAHHIDYFTRSLNNDSQNIMILCPNHHGIIHDVNPVFERKRLCFVYKNGYTEALAINNHLNPNYSPVKASS